MKKIVLLMLILMPIISQAKHCCVGKAGICWPMANTPHACDGTFYDASCDDICHGGF